MKWKLLLQLFFSSLMLMVLSAFTTVGAFTVLTEKAVYPFIGADIWHMNGFLSLVLAALGGAALALALLWSSDRVADFVHIDPAPGWKPHAKRYTAWLIVILLVALALPIFVEQATHHVNNGYPQYDDVWLLRYSRDVAFTILLYIDNTFKGLWNFVISVITIVGFAFTFFQLRDFHSRISSFGELMDRVVDLSKDADVHDKLHIISFTPAIGFLAEPKKWAKLRAALINVDSEASAEEGGSQNKIMMIVPKIDQVNDWHAQFEGRESRRWQIHKLKFSSIITKNEIQSANQAAKEIRDKIGLRTIEKIKSGTYIEVDFDLLPGYYAFFTSERAIIVNPLFIPLKFNGTVHIADLQLTAPKMIGYETTDRAIINDMFAQFEYIVKMSDSAQSAKPSPAATPPAAAAASGSIAPK